MSACVAVVALCAIAPACSKPPIRDTLTYVMRVDRSSPRNAGRILVETPIGGEDDPWARFVARHDAHCAQGEGVWFEAITITTRPPLRIETLFDDFVLLSVRRVSGEKDDPWDRRALHDIARGSDPSGTSFRLTEILSSGWRGEGEWRLHLLAATAAEIDAVLPIDLVIEMKVSGRCGPPI